MRTTESRGRKMPNKKFHGKNYCFGFCDSIKAADERSQNQWNFRKYNLWWKCHKIYQKDQNRSWRKGNKRSSRLFKETFYSVGIRVSGCLWSYFKVGPFLFSQYLLHGFKKSRSYLPSSAKHTEGGANQFLQGWFDEMQLFSKETTWWDVYWLFLQQVTSMSNYCYLITQLFRCKDGSEFETNLGSLNCSDCEGVFSPVSESAWACSQCKKQRDSKLCVATLEQLDKELKSQSEDADCSKETVLQFEKVIRLEH